jgi:hypothetical protein
MIAANILPGDMVAILPTKDSTPSDVLELAAVDYVGHAIILLIGGRMYAKHDGQGMRTTTDGCIVSATDEHRAALKAKGQ